MKAPAHTRLQLTAAGFEDHPRLQLSGHPFGGGPHTVAQHWASPRESAEFPTRVKEALTLLGQLKTRLKASRRTMFEGQRDSVHSSGEAQPYGMKIDRRDITTRVCRGEVWRATSVRLMGQTLVEGRMARRP